MNELVKAVKDFDIKAPDKAIKTLNTISTKTEKARILLSVLHDLARTNGDKFLQIQVGKLDDLMIDILSYSWIGDDDVSDEEVS